MRITCDRHCTSSQGPPATMLPKPNRVTRSATSIPRSLKKHLYPGMAPLRVLFPAAQEVEMLRGPEGVADVESLEKGVWRLPGSTLLSPHRPPESLPTAGEETCAASQGPAYKEPTGRAADRPSAEEGWGVGL